MSSDYAEFVEQPDGTLLRAPHNVTCNGGAVRVRSHLQISDIAPALFFREKIQKWKVILHFYTSNTAQLDPEYRKYYQY
jgi:hypothetical protein